MGKKLRAKEEYSIPPRGLYFAKGQVFEPDDALYLFLMADSPGTFEVVEEAKAIVAPPVDKMTRSPKVKK